jgi:hypothetical protein
MLKHHEPCLYKIGFLLCSLYDKIQDANVVVVVVVVEVVVTCELFERVGEGWFTNVRCYLALNTLQVLICLTKS